jgi:predicted flavoprotein YhiN
VPSPPLPRGEVEQFDAVILATGGDSTDPEDSGYRLAKPFGHSVTRLAPSLTALVTLERWPANLAGLTLRDARIRAALDGRKVADERGSLLFTHRGISGPLAFRISSLAAYLPYSAAQPLRLALSLHPEDDETALARRVDEALARYPRRTVAAAVRTLVPRPLVPAVLEQASVPEGRRVAQASRAERQSIAKTLAGIRRARRGDRHRRGHRAAPRGTEDDGVADRARAVFLRGVAGHRRFHRRVQPAGGLDDGPARRAGRPAADPGPRRVLTDTASSVKLGAHAHRER